MNNDLFNMKYLDIRQDGFLVLDYQWNITFINPVAANLLKRDFKELIGENLWETIPQIVGSEIETAY